MQPIMAKFAPFNNENKKISCDNSQSFKESYQFITSNTKEIQKGEF